MVNWAEGHEANRSEAIRAACSYRLESEEMTNQRVQPALNLTIAALFAVVLAACETTGSQQAALQEPG